MNLPKFGYALSAIVLSLSLAPSASWSSRAYGPMITGTVTAATSSGTIEVDHRSYHVKPNSSAAKVLSSLYVGETVDMVVDGPGNGADVEVVSIVPHAGS
jgi:hypothetical protein